MHGTNQSNAIPMYQWIIYIRNYIWNHLIQSETRLSHTQAEYHRYREFNVIGTLFKEIYHRRYNDGLPLGVGQLIEADNQYILNLIKELANIY
jgi:hypothetical protein